MAFTFMSVDTDPIMAISMGNWTLSPRGLSLGAAVRACCRCSVRSSIMSRVGPTPARCVSCWCCRIFRLRSNPRCRPVMGGGAAVADSGTCLMQYRRARTKQSVSITISILDSKKKLYAHRYRKSAHIVQEYIHCALKPGPSLPPSRPSTFKLLISFLNMHMCKLICIPCNIIKIRRPASALSEKLLCLPGPWGPAAVGSVDLEGIITSQIVYWRVFFILLHHI